MRIAGKLARTTLSLLAAAIPPIETGLNANRHILQRPVRELSTDGRIISTDSLFVSRFSSLSGVP
jgi:hypothetical protein